MGGPAFEAFPSLTMSRVDTIADGKGFLEDLKDFATARGWNIDSYLTDKKWYSAGGGWVTAAGGGSNPVGDFLQISSSGYGSQELRYRFFVYAGTSEQLMAWQMIDPAYDAVDTGIVQVPYLSTSHHCVSGNTQYSISSFPDSTFPGCWFIGNDRFIAWEAEVATGAALVSGACGTWDLLIENQATDELSARWHGFFRSTATKWSDYASSPTSFGSPLRNNGYTNNSDYHVYWDSQGVGGGGTTTAKVKYAISCAPNGADTPSTWTESKFGRDNEIVKYSLNAYSNKRVLIRPRIYLQDSDNLWMPAGFMPLYHTNVSGLTMGQQITYGGKTFICFPNGIGSYSFGHCYDIT